jgi:transposase
MPDRTTYDDHIKASVSTGLAAGLSASDIAAQCNIPAGTIRSWKSRGIDAAADALGRETRRRAGELLAGYLADALAVLRNQLEVFCDQAWLEKQRASELALLHGTIADKTIRLLEALDAGRRYEAPDDGGAGAHEAL